MVEPNQPVHLDPSRHGQIRLSVGRLLQKVGHAPTDDAAVLIEDGRIVQVGPEERVPDPEDAYRISFPSGTALPGLIDTHVHLTFPVGDDLEARLAVTPDVELLRIGLARAEILLRSGITTTCDLGARGSLAFEIRAAIEAGRAIGPHLLVAGRPVTPPGGHCHYLGGEARGRSGVRAAVRQLIADGVDIIKIMASGGVLTDGTQPRTPSFDPSVLRQAVDEAHQSGRRVTCHAHGITAIRDAIEVGADSIEHASMLDDAGRWRYDATVGRALAESRVRVVSTVSVTKRIWSTLPTPVAPKVTRDAFRYDVRVSNVRHLMADGVTIVAGTDAGVPRSRFEDQLVSELEALTEAGATRTESLAMATHLAAQHLGIADETGTIEIGKRADIIVVPWDPTADLSVLRRPVTVIRGRLVMASSDLQPGSHGGGDPRRRQS